MSSGNTDDRLIGVLRRRGVEIDSPTGVALVEEATHVLVAALGPELMERCEQFINHIPDESWKALFATLAPEWRRAVIKALGLPGDGQRRPTAAQQSHVVRLLRHGLEGKKDQAWTAAHELTRPVRSALIEAARQGAAWSGAAGKTTEVRAAAVALCLRHRFAFLPVVLCWMHEHDQDTFDLLLSSQTGRTAIQSFWDSVTATPAANEDQPRTLVDTARAAVDEATTACHDALAELTDGRAPHESTIAALVHVRAVLTETAASLAEQIEVTVAPTLSAIEEAVEQMARGSESDAEIRLLLTAEVSRTAASALAAAVAMAEGVLDRWPPADEDDRAHLDLLRGIVNLATAAVADNNDDSDIDADYEQLRAAAPKELVPLLTAAVRGKLYFPEQPSPDTTREDTSLPEAPGEVQEPVETTSPEPAIETEEKAENTEPAEAEEMIAQDGLLVDNAASPPTMNGVSDPVEVATIERIAADSGLAPAIAAKAVAWLDHGQFALAHHLLAPHTLGLAEAAAFAAVATAVTGPDCTHNRELESFAASADVDLLVDGDAARLLTTSAAIGAAVTTGNPALGDLLVSLSDRLDVEVSSHARLLGETLRQGLLVGRGVDALSEICSAEQEMAAAAGAVRDRLDAHRTIRLPRASAVLARLRKASANPGEDTTSLGAALHAAASDSRTDFRSVRDVLDRLAKTSTLERLIDDDDAAHRPPSSPRITGNVRREMLTTLRDDIAAADKWVRAVERHDRSTAARTDTRVEELRSILLSTYESAIQVLDTYQDDSDELVAASARAARTCLSQLVERVTEGTVAGTGNAADGLVLEFPLLAVAGYAWDDHMVALEPARDLTADLLALPDTGVDLADAALAKAESDDFRTGEYLAAQLLEPQRTELLTLLADNCAHRVEGLRDQLRTMRRQLVRGDVGGLDREGPHSDATVTFDAVTEELFAGLLTDALNNLDEANPDLRTVTQAHDAVQQRITELRREETRRLAERLAQLPLTGHGPDVARIRDHLEWGRLDLAEDDLDHLSNDDPLFQGHQDEHLKQFFPAGVEALPEGIDKALLSAVREERSHAALPDAPLPSRLRIEVADGLESWTRLRAAYVDGWRHETAVDNLLPALRLIGLDVRPSELDRLDGARSFPVYARGRRFLEIKSASLTGKTLVPEFGSVAQGRYRLLIVWNQPSAEELDEWRESDNSFQPLIICYLGTLSSRDRTQLARMWSDPSRRATVVLDDALLTWVAVRRGNFDEFMRLSLPFTAVQPYLTEKRADVSPEMFYGREREKRQLLQPGKAPSIVYGGRGMGKSALMYRIASEADDSDLVVVWFEVDKVPGIHEQPDLLWTDLEHRLVDKGVGRRSTAARSNSRDAVTRSIQRWTQEHSGKRLLLLLDEAEGFVEGDAPKFAHVRRLLDLTTSTASRCQVVFAGLHSVQHYSVGNSPLSPTGHLQIGPLTSQHAYDLLARPLAALGYRLDDSDAQRVLLHCNYQPYLIQLVAEKLLARQFAARTVGRELAPPPWHISATAVTEVLNDADSRRDLRAALGLTLDLDKRTRVIANVLAMHAYSNPKGTRMADVELFAQCRSAWPRGFEETHADAFRQLLDELEGLGVLADTNDTESGRAIRNETVLRVLGSKDEVEQNLRHLPGSALPLRQAREYQRPIRADEKRCGPLVSAQHAQLFKKGNIARVLVGSEATGVDQIVATLQETRPEGVELEPVDMRTLGEFKTKLETGAVAARRYLVIGDLITNTNVDACQQALDFALGDQAGVGIPLDRDASRTAALIAGVSNIKWLLRLAATSQYEEHMMPLQRYDEYTLPLRWQGDPVLGIYATEEFATRTLDLTGGWPLLVEDLALDAMNVRLKSARALGAALDRLEKNQADVGWCVAFLRRTGADFTGWSEMRPLVTALAEYEGPCAPTDLATLTGRTIEEVEVFARVARWLALISMTATGELVLAPLIAHSMVIAAG